jgi:hypothetical protein
MLPWPIIKALDCSLIPHSTSPTELRPKLQSACLLQSSTLCHRQVHSGRIVAMPHERRNTKYQQNRNVNFNDSEQNNGISETVTLRIIQITTRDSRQSGAGGGGGVELHALPNVTNVREDTTTFLNCWPFICTN